MKNNLIWTQNLNPKISILLEKRIYWSNENFVYLIFKRNKQAFRVVLTILLQNIFLKLDRLLNFMELSYGI